MKRSKPLKRTPMKRGAPLKRGGKKGAGKAMRQSPIKPKRRRGGAMPEDVYLKVMVVRAAGRCEAALPGICTGGAEEWHHRQPRDRYNDCVENGAALCSACHRHITDVSPADGFERGLRVSRHLSGSPGEVPMYQFGRRWVLLNPDGSTKLVNNKEKL